jgi:hypothetical protein
MGRPNDPDMCKVCDTRNCQTHSPEAQTAKTGRPWWRR